MYTQDTIKVLQYLDLNTQRYGQWFGAKTVFRECQISEAEMDFIIDEMARRGYIITSKNPLENRNIAITGSGKLFIKHEDEKDLRMEVLKGMKEVQPKELSNFKFPWGNFWTAVGALAAVAAAIIAWTALG